MVSFIGRLLGKQPFKAQLAFANEETRNGQPKAFMPKFLYKPPYGYPRFNNMNYIRWLATTPYVDMCIETIVSEITSIEWDIVVKEELKKDYLDADGEVTSAKKAEIDVAKSFFLNPNTNSETFDEVFVKKPVRDMLEIGSGVLEKVYNLKGELVEVVARDGATFTKNPDIHGLMTDRADFVPQLKILPDGQPVLNPFQQIPANDARTEAAYFQYGWIAGPMPIPFGKKEILWLEKQNRTDEIYGYSPVMVLAKTLQMLMWSIDADLEYYDDNNIPKGIIGLEGADGVDIEAY